MTSLQMTKYPFACNQDHGNQWFNALVTEGKKEWDSVFDVKWWVSSTDVAVSPPQYLECNSNVVKAQRRSILR